MAFIKEIIQTDEQKAFFDSFGFRDYKGDVLKSRKDPTEWYINKEKDMYFFAMGGGCFEIPHMHGLMTPQGLIVIEQNELNNYIKSDESKNVFFVHWSVDKISYPPKMQYYCDEISALVVEAITDSERENSTDTKKYVAVIDSIAAPQIYTDWEETHYAVNNLE